MKTLVCSLVAVTVLSSSAWAADAAKGTELYNTRCKSCHGADGTGNPAIAKMMKVELKPLAGAPDAAIKDAVAKGVGKMKPIAGIAGGDLDNLVAAIHGLKK